MSEIRAAALPARARMRRDIAEGTPVVEAVLRHTEVADGAGKRVHDWVSLQAAQLGMSRELLDLLTSPNVTDVLINGTSMWVDRGRGCEPVESFLDTPQTVRRLAVQMAAAAGKRLDDAQPLVDGFLGESFRLHAVLPPLAKNGPIISLRVLHPGGHTLDELVKMGTLTGELQQLLAALVRSRASILISGATGVGKTTLLGALLREVPPEQRIVCIEEVTELFPAHPHVVHLQERQPNIEGSGGITLADLVKASLRMRPDRVVLGECRGAEIREVVTAMNTGHTGGFTTVHANSLADVPARMVALGSLAGMDQASVSTHVGSAFQVVVHLARDSAGRRRVADVGSFAGTSPLEVVPAWEYRREGYRRLPGAEHLEELASREGWG